MTLRKRGSRDDRPGGGSDRARAGIGRERATAEFPRGTTTPHTFAEDAHRDLARGIDWIHDVRLVFGPP